jgi:phospholipid/cholesterol/gamma-HCH transport system ATP-binding protein
VTNTPSAAILDRPALELHDVSVVLGRPVLRRVQWSVPRGCLYGLIGPGASGKSVLLKTLAGLLRPSSGRVLVLGQDVTALDEARLVALRQRMGMLFQNNALFDFMSVADNVAFPLRQRGGFSEAEIRERVGERLARVGLAGFEDRLPARLSGGQKKRVGLARATVTSAEVVLLDEPAAGLDPVTSQRIFDLLKAEQRRAGMTAVIVSSDLDRLLPMVDRLGMLLDGKLVFDDTVERARKAPDAAVMQFVNGCADGPL